jgi:hypothetical protein
VTNGESTENGFLCAIDKLPTGDRDCLPRTLLGNSGKVIKLCGHFLQAMENNTDKKRQQSCPSFFQGLFSTTTAKASI